ncbi:MAG: 50S ribosomal protein L28 [Legionellales bacterium]|nr:50S ribosomal protein L28 [Legionellales bacterium]
MALECMVTGKHTVRGNHVAHCNKKVRRSFKANARWKRFFVPAENRIVRLFVSSKGMRVIDKRGIETVLTDIRSRGINV